VLGDGRAGAVTTQHLPVVAWAEGPGDHLPGQRRLGRERHIGGDPGARHRAGSSGGCQRRQRRPCAYAAVQPPATPTADQLASYARLERRRRRYPAAVGYLLPTPIGNILRAAERRPADKYGLDTIIVWPHLWLLLPETTRRELRTARTSLDTAVAAATWGLLFCVFTPLTPLAAPSAWPWPL
jgi:hypothetical protein